MIDLPVFKLGESDISTETASGTQAYMTVCTTVCTNCSFVIITVYMKYLT